MRIKSQPVLDVFVLALGCLAAYGSAASAAPVIQDHIPDFYQHQKSNQNLGAPPNPYVSFADAPANTIYDPNSLHPFPAGFTPGYNQTWDHDANGATPEVSRNWWEGNHRAGAMGGWCGTTAWVNALYHLDKKFPGLYNRGGGGANWLEQYTYTNEDLARESLQVVTLPLAIALDLPVSFIGGAIGGCAHPPQVRSYVSGTQIPGQPPGTNYVPMLTQYYWGSDSKVHIRTTDFTDDLVNDPVAPYPTMFDLYFDTLKTQRRNKALVTLIETPDYESDKLMPDFPWWWAGSFHVMTGAGVDSDKDRRALFLADPNDTAVAATGTGNGPGADWGHSYAAADPFPLGVPRYLSATIDPDGRTFASGTYNGMSFHTELGPVDISAAIKDIYVLMIVPEPASLALALLAVGLLMFRTARRRTYR